MSATQLSRRGFLAAAAAASAAVPAIAQAAPSRYAFETNVWTGSQLIDQDGHAFTLRDMRQPITLLKLWAGWCPACASEMPLLANMASTMARDVNVLLISHPEYWEADLAAARRRKLPFRLATFAPGTSPAIVQQALLDQAGRYTVPKSLVFRQRDYAIVSQSLGARDWAEEGKIRGWMG